MVVEEVNDSLELMALRRAVTNALERKRWLGQYAVVWRGGRPVRIGPEALGSAIEYGMKRAAPASEAREPGPQDSKKGESE